MNFWPPVWPLSCPCHMPSLNLMSEPTSQHCRCVVLFPAKCGSYSGHSPIRCPGSSSAATEQRGDSRPGLSGLSGVWGGDTTARPSPEATQGTFLSCLSGEAPSILGDLVCTAMQMAFKLGLSHTPLAEVGLNALEEWSVCICRQVMQPYYKDILPTLDGYLKTSALSGKV